ncbi:hypothetical protein KAR91_53590 [Candidatus Pacearchaeota archaeon]|nr:hypothetical protein [Candidatus Pacearchaeota archaeon]
MKLTLEKDAIWLTSLTGENAEYLLQDGVFYFMSGKKVHLDITDQRTIDYLKVELAQSLTLLVDEMEKLK